MIYKVVYDRLGSPVAHTGSCFCPSMTAPPTGSQFSRNKQDETETWEAPDIEQMIYDYFADSLEAKELSRQRAVELMRLAPCVEAPAGIGRRSQLQLGETILMHERRPPAKTSDASSADKKTFHASPRSAKIASQPSALKTSESSPTTSHSDCDHSATKSARAACRRKRSKS